MSEKALAITPREAPEANTVAPMVAMIERVAMDPTIPIDRLEQMLAMKERLDAKAAEVAFNEAFAACQAEMPKVIARHKNDQTNSKYAKLADVYDIANPISTAHGFSFSTFPASCQKDGCQGIRWELRHSAGHVIGDVAEVPTDDKGMKGTQNKTATHAFGSTISYGRRYIFCMIFNLATEDDNDGNNLQKSGPINEEQFRTIRKLLDQVGGEDAFLGMFKVDVIESIPSARFYEAEALLRRKAAAMAKKSEGEE